MWMVRVSLCGYFAAMLAITAHAADGRKALRTNAIASPFKVTAVTPFIIGSAIRPSSHAGLDLAADPAMTEEIVVYGKRWHRLDAEGIAPAPLSLGSATLSSSTVAEPGGFSGMRVTAAFPIHGISGLSATASVAAGHDQINTSTTAASAAAVLGLKLDF